MSTRRVGTPFLLVLSLFAGPPLRSVHAATITIVPGAGFTDTTPVAPVGGNTANTLGAQRLIAAQFAADIWAAKLVSSVEIRVDMQFSALSCGPSSGLLGFAGSTMSLRDFAGAPLASTWYPIALANAITGVDQCPPASACTTANFNPDDISSNFQLNVGTAGCLTGMSWYYGLDANPGGSQFDFVTVVLHELTHGLGFTTLVTLSTGAKSGGFDDAFMANLEDHSTTKLWPIMSNAERITSSKDNGDLHWVGTSVVAGGASLVAGRDPISGHVKMYAPTTLQLGSSVVHFDTSLSPDEIMEPFIVTSTHNVGLADDLLEDVGWTLVGCGNGLLDPGEECDDGNATDCDGCSTSCKLEPGYQCGDGVKRASCGEQCDDGGTSNGDGCSASCQIEVSSTMPVYGIAAGGTVQVVINGVTVNVTTTAGETNAQVAADIAAAINANATLQGLGVNAVATGTQVITNGSVTSKTSGDVGISFVVPRGSAIPAAPEHAVWLFALSLGIGGAVILLRRAHE